MMTLSEAAKTIIDAGCSGSPLMTWYIRKYLDEKEPTYPPGDAWCDDKKLHSAIQLALCRIAATDGADPLDPTPQEPPCPSSQ